MPKKIRSTFLPLSNHRGCLASANTRKSRDLELAQAACESGDWQQALLLLEDFRSLKIGRATRFQGLGESEGTLM